MKSQKAKLVLLSFLMLGVVAATWSPPNSTDLMVGTSPNVYSPNGYVAVVGDNNQVSAKDTLVTGQSNSITATTPNTSNSFMAGFNNTVRGATTSTGAICAATIGSDNNIMSEYGWAMGYGNDVSGRVSVALGTINNVSAEKATALGRGLIVDQIFSTVVGLYNAPMGVGDVFAIGAGSSGTVRFTALRVTSDGGVILGRAQGDVSMGNYQ